MRGALKRVAIGAAILTGCAAPSSDRDRVLLVTTTSLEDSGILDALLDAYHAAQERYRLSATAVGSGAALEIGRRGDADVLLTHDPEGERRFRAEGHTAEQGPVMMNRFMIAGAPADAAGVREATSAAEAFRRIASAGARFVSRGDDSGTHRREREIWSAAGARPWEERPSWYIEAGTGMGETLHMASELGAYLLTDRATYLHLCERVRLEPLLEGGALLENHYTYSLPRSPPNPDGARDFVRWLTGPGQEVISAYGVPRFGEPLFRPTAR